MISAKPNRPIATPTTPMPSDSSGMPKSKRATPELTSVPTMPEQQAEDDHRDRLQQRSVREHDGADQAEHHQREVFGGPELQRERGQRQRERRRRSIVAHVPAKNEPSAAIASAAPAWPLRAIW